VILGRLEGILQESAHHNAFLIFHKKLASTKVYLYDCSVVSAASVLLFGGNLSIQRVHGGKRGGKSEKYVVVVGDWIRMKISELHAILFKRLQNEIDGLLQDKVENMSTDTSSRQEVLVKVLEAILA
jgi:hypothetical protein